MKVMITRNLPFALLSLLSLTTSNYTLTSGCANGQVASMSIVIQQLRQLVSSSAKRFEQFVDKANKEPLANYIANFDKNAEEVCKLINSLNTLIATLNPESIDYKLAGELKSFLVNQLSVIQRLQTILRNNISCTNANKFAAQLKPLAEELQSATHVKDVIARLSRIYQYAHSAYQTEAQDVHALITRLNTWLQQPKKADGLAILAALRHRLNPK